MTLLDKMRNAKNVKEAMILVLREIDAWEDHTIVARAFADDMGIDEAFPPQEDVFWFDALLEAIDRAPDVEGKARVRAIVSKLAEMRKADNEVGQES